MSRPGKRWLVSLAVVAVVVAGGQKTASGQCVYDCDGDGFVKQDELGSLANRLFGGSAVAPCSPDSFLGAELTDLLKAVKVALTAQELCGTCMVPGPLEGPDAIPCADGTIVTAFGCKEDDNRCLDDEPPPDSLRQLGMATTTMGAFKGLGDCSEIFLHPRVALKFAARVEAATVQQSLSGPCIGVLCRGAGNTCTGGSTIISPFSEAGVQIVRDVGIQKFVPEGINSVLTAVVNANANTSLAGLGVIEAVNIAKGTALADPDVEVALEVNLRPTPGASPTPTQTVTVSPTPTLSPTLTLPPTPTLSPTLTQKFTPTSTRTPTATPTPRRYFVYVANSGDDMVSVIDTSTRQVVGLVAVGDEPYLVAASPDGSLVAVSNRARNTQMGSLSIIKVSNNTALPPITRVSNTEGMLGVAFPRLQDFNSLQPRVFATNDAPASHALFSIDINDPLSPTKNVTLPLNGRPYAIAISPTSGTLYVTNELSNAVSKISPSLPGAGTLIPVGMVPHGIAISPPRPPFEPELAFVANFGAQSVSVINIASNTPTPLPTVTIGQAPEAVAIHVTPNGAFAYVTNNGVGENTVSVISASMAVQNPGTALVNTVHVGSQPFGVAITPDGAFAYVANSGDGTVSVIDTRIAESGMPQVVPTIVVGQTPRGIAIATEQP